MVEDMVVLSILVNNIAVVEIEEDTEVANFASLNCSIVEVVDTKDNRVEVTVEIFDMLVGL